MIGLALLPIGSYEIALFRVVAWRQTVFSIGHLVEGFSVDDQFQPPTGRRFDALAVLQWMPAPTDDDPVRPARRGGLYRPTAGADWSHTGFDEFYLLRDS